MVSSAGVERVGDLSAAVLTEAKWDASIEGLFDVMLESLSLMREWGLLKEPDNPYILDYTRARVVQNAQDVVLAVWRAVESSKEDEKRDVFKWLNYYYCGTEEDKNRFRQALSDFVVEHQYVEERIMRVLFE